MHRPQGPSGSLDLPGLLHPGLAEHREQDDPSVWRDPVGDPNGVSVQVEPQFAELAVELSGVRLTQQHPLLGEKIHVERRSGELRGRQRLQPVPDLRFQLHTTPSHSADAIGRDVYRVQR
jgi:hypothetical protein